MTKKQITYIVNAPTYDEDSGGAIFLHELVHALNSLGERAVLWPLEPIFRPGLRARIRNWRRPRPYQRNPTLNTPLAQKSDLTDDAVVIYPEIVPGNPLGARNVVRWLLYKPGMLLPYKFTENEMFFRVFEKADMPELTGGAPDLYLWKVNRTYRNENRPDRDGVCYIVRKGSYKPRISETEAPDAIRIDDLGHVEINDIFNRCRTFYSYDEATMYSQFAAICGCLSVVVPGEHASREEWVRNHGLGRYGVAYGSEDAAHALATRDQLFELLDQKERNGIETVKRFVTLTKERFGRASAP